MMEFAYGKEQALFITMRRMTLELTSPAIHYILATKRPKKNLVPTSGYLKRRQQVSPKCRKCYTKREDATSQCRSLVPF